MFSLLRRRFGISGVIAVIALVFAMAGGALAAKKYVITSTKQIKPSVLAALQGAKGDAGSAGAAGGAGTNGTNGSTGISVTNNGVPTGKTECEGRGGAEFKVGSGSPTYACTGEEGSQGPNGNPWVVGQAPSGALMRGTWAASGVASAENNNFYAPISTVVPLGGPIIAVQEVGGPFCPNGTAENPQPGEFESLPKSGVLCYFPAESTNVKPHLGSDTKLQVSNSGIVLRFRAAAAGAVSTYGTWAMLAP